MRYQRISPDSLALSNGRRASSNPTTMKSYKEEEEEKVETPTNNNSNSNVTSTSTRTPSSILEGKGFSRFRSPSKTQKQDHPNNGGEVGNKSVESNGGGGGGDVLLQWGHRKRSRCSRGLVTSTDDSSSSSSMMQQQQMQPNNSKLQRRSSAPHQTSCTSAMPPPSLLPCGTAAAGGGGGGKGSSVNNNKSCPRNHSSTASPIRTASLEERSGGGCVGGGCSNNRGGVSCRSTSRVGKRSPSLVDKNTAPPCVAASRDDKMNGHSTLLQHQEAMVIDSKHAISATPKVVGDDAANNNNNNNYNNIISKMNGGGFEVVNEWPRIYIPLSRKEKEEDFMAMKGTKLPHRPKKRPKAVDRMLQYCYPGMWLSDLTRGRYEVREKKSSASTKKPKRRGLKGMESMDTDSE